MIAPWRAWAQPQAHPASAGRSATAFLMMRLALKRTSSPVSGVPSCDPPVCIAPLHPEEYIRRRKPHLDRLFPTVQALPGAVAVVEALFAAAVPLAVATSSTRELFDQKLRHHGWAQRFRVVVCGDDPRLTRQKPAPDIFLLAAAELGVPPERCLVFEDSPTGVEAAKAAGTQVVAIPNEAVDVGLVASADLVIRRFAELEL